MSIVDLFIMSGQSNMQGQSEAPAEKILPVSFGWEYKMRTDSLVLVTHPSGEDIFSGEEPVLLSAHQGYGGLLPAFAEAYGIESGRRACYAHCAKGATILSQWRKGTARYRILTEKITKAEACLKRNGYAPGVKSFVWLQGESDGAAGTLKEQYKEMLFRLKNDLFSDTGLSHFMILRVAQFHDHPCLPIMEAQEELCRTEPDFVMLTRITSSFTEENGFMQGESAPFHYTNAGYELLGQTAGQNAARYLSGRPFDAGKEDLG